LQGEEFGTASPNNQPTEEMVPIYRAPVDEVMFLLTDVLQVARYDNLPGFADATPDLAVAILGEAGKLCEEVIQPLNRGGDQEGCTRRDDGSVATPRGFKQAYRQYADGGWVGLSAPPEYGGQGLPGLLTVAINEFMTGANMAFAMYPGLSQGALATILSHGTTEQKARYLPKMVEGRWTGTMNLTEAHCGTDLGLLRTKAVKQADGSYRITGTKIFISAGEHDLAENIVHLVLARIEGAPAGIRGISMFIVPKLLPDADGAPGARNAVTCGAVEEKMGIHGNATCVMNYDGATGWLIGAENRGINAMFTMMNAARLGVGVQGLALSEVAYQNAAAYAKDRLQGRAPTSAKFPERPADPLLVHPDVRRMLLTMRAFNEAARALVLWTALQEDVAQRAPEEASRQAAEDHMALLTPVIKAMLTDRGFANTVLAQQIYGGHGYIAEHGMEQLVRDARIAMLYEGANGIQALDLVGRKLAQDDGRALKAFMAEMQHYIAAHGAVPMKPYVDPLATALSHLHEATIWLMRNAQTAPDNAAPDNAAAGATDYLHLMGLVVLGYMWCRIVEAAQARLAADGTAARMRDKLVTGRFFVERMLPETAVHLARIRLGAANVMELPADAF
jgi:acyl-CoA dehydrogenase